MSTTERTPKAKKQDSFKDLVSRIHEGIHIKQV